MNAPAPRLILLLLWGVFFGLLSACGSDSEGQALANNASLGNNGQASADAGAGDTSGPSDASSQLDSTASDATSSDATGLDGSSPDASDLDHTPSPPELAVGVPCATDSDCPSGQCESVGGQRRGVCTVACAPGEGPDGRPRAEPNGACPPGWACETIYSGDGKFCTCESAEEVCDGLDNDCDGLVDEGDQNERLCGADALCTANTCGCPSGYRCQEACRDLQRDPNHCGSCSNRCDVACNEANCVVAVDVSVGADHVCAVLSDGQVRCVGQNDHGQLGDGTTTASEHPVDALWMNDAAQVAAADRFSCARSVSGSIHCWGYNGQGQVAEAPLTERHQPARWAEIDSAVDLDVGHYTGCAVTSAGEVMCWGPHGFSVPTVVEGAVGATKVAVGDLHRCALVGAGQIACWGNNARGQLGDGTTITRHEFRLIPMLADVVDVDAGEEHTCVLQSSGAVRCFGSNSDGQLGLDSLLELTSPSRVDGLAAASDVTAGARHSCAIAGADKKVFCWGQNHNGQLGDGTTGHASTPVEVRGLVGAERVDAGDHTTCALTTAGQVYCWGERFGVNPRRVAW